MISRLIHVSHCQEAQHAMQSSKRQQGHTLSPCSPNDVLLSVLLYSPTAQAQANNNIALARQLTEKQDIGHH